jgi:hypothetical protein
MTYDHHSERWSLGNGKTIILTTELECSLDNQYQLTTFVNEGGLKHESDSEPIEIKSKLKTKTKLSSSSETQIESET